MAQFPRTTGRWTVATFLAASLLVSNLPLSYAGPGDTNSTNYGENVVGGTYYNTAGNQTTFTNANGLTVGAGTTVRGLEVNGAGQLTNNGGHLHFDAPNGTIRVDAGSTIDAGAIFRDGAFQGNGGTISFNAGALVLNGNILVPGLNGGTIVTSVGSMTVGPDARLDATSTALGAMPGQIKLNSTGLMEIKNGAVIDASGNYIGGYNAGVIEISGSIVNLDGIVMANGLNGSQGGNIGIFGSEIKLGSNAKVMANGSEGGEGGVIVAAASNSMKADAGSVISANGGQGANGGTVVVGALPDNAGNPVIVTRNIQTDGVITANGGDASLTAAAGSGGNIAVVSTQSTINNGQISANGGNGFRTVNAGNGGIVVAGSNGTAVNNGVISANGGQGYNGWQPSRGGEGGLVAFAGNTVENNGRLTANGGNGGSNPNIVRGSVVNGTQNSVGEDGADGGNGGAVLIDFNTSISNKGSIEVTGGNGGNGQEALADANGAHQIAYGGNGGNAGYGGLVRFYGQPGQDVLNNVNVNGGSGGQGGVASVKSDCGCATPGSKGACGAPGQIEVLPKPPCTGGSCSPTPPPGTPPTTPLYPLYPKEYSSLGDTLPPNAGNVLSYTRSIFLARSPLPIIQKKTPPAPPVQPPAKIMVVKPKPKPPQKKVPVRGYW